MRSLALASLLLLAAPATALETVLESEHFALHVHFDAPAIASRSLELVEATWPVVAGLFGTAEKPLEEKLVIHLYRNPADYQAAEASLTNGEFARNLAFTHWDTGAAHIALQPDRKDALLGELGLDYQTARLLTHEAAHVVRLDSCPNFRSHPRWFADAVASWTDVVVLGQQGWIEEPANDPFFSSQMVRVQRKAGEEQLPAFSAVIEAESQDQGWQGTYDLHAQLFPFLAADRKGDVLGELCREARRMGGGPEFARGLAQAVYGVTKRKPKPLDKAFAKFVAKLEPEWEQLYNSLQATGDDWVQLAFPEVNAIAWRTAPVRKGKLRLTGEARVLPGRTKQINILLDRRDDGFVQVCLVAGYGATVFEHFYEANKWEKRASAEAPLVLDEFHAFELRTKGGQLILELNGEQIVEVALERDFTGPWGLGAQKSAAGIWRGIAAK